MSDVSKPLRKLWIQVICEIILLGYCELAFGQSDSALKQQFLDEAPSAWEAYEEDADALQGEIRRQTWRNAELVLNIRFTLKNRPNCRLVMHASDVNQLAPGTMPDEHTTAFNSAYAFRLTRQQPTAPWVATEIKRRSTDETDCALIDEARRKSAFLRSLIRTVEGTELRDLIRQPTFRVLSATRTFVSGEELVTLEFDNRHAMSSKPFMPIQRGTLTLAPNQLWTIRSATADCEFGNGSTSVTTLTNELDASTEFPTPKRQETHTELNSRRQGRVRFKEETVFELTHPISLPTEGEFKMAAFGLPEPFDDLAESPTRWFLWSMLAGIGLVVITGVYAWWRKRVGA